MEIISVAGSVGWGIGLCIGNSAVTFSWSNFDPFSIKMRRNEELYAPFSNQKLFIDILMNEFLCYSKRVVNNKSLSSSSIDRLLQNRIYILLHTIFGIIAHDGSAWERGITGVEPNLTFLYGRTV